jgi:uncharacterized protein YdiU (UPF0061 family)
MAYGEKHDEHILRILAGNQEADTIIALQKAIYLTMDATEKDSKKAPEALDYLKRNCNTDKDISVKQVVSPNADHQWYTHLGWDYDYNMAKVEHKLEDDFIKKLNDNFSLRKCILKSVIEELFPEFSSEKINSFSALLYYIHIMGDFRYNEEEKNLIPIGELPNELEKHLKIVFEDNVGGLIMKIKKELTNVRFVDCAEPLDRIFEYIFENIPELIKGLK